MSLESLQKIKLYINKQYKDIETWEEESDEEKGARIDELHCLETYLDCLIDKEVTN